MRNVLTFVVATVLAASASLAVAQSDQDHAAHHPEGASSPAGAKATAAKSAAKAAPRAIPKAATKASAPTPAQMDAMMKSMQEMHDKMMAATTPEERQALMAEHMKTMRDGMAMMGQMHGGTASSSMPMDSSSMGRRMDMMQMMMQMMMDRLPPSPGK